MLDLEWDVLVGSLCPHSGESTVQGRLRSELRRDGLVGVEFS